jgi:hypothetical protein
LFDVVAFNNTLMHLRYCGTSQLYHIRALCFSPYSAQRRKHPNINQQHNMATATPAKIRVALIGLNAPPSGTPSGTNWAASGHLPYLLNSERYQLVALQNSSAARAAEAIKAYALDASTKAYGTPEGKLSHSRFVMC